MKSEPSFRSQGRSSVRVHDIDAREWWLWAFTITVTLALAAGITALSVPGYHLGVSIWFWSDLKDRVRGLAALVVIFDIYTVYQHCQLHRLRKHFADRNELFELISENAADMIAVVDKDGNRLYNSPAYSKLLGYSPAELQKHSSFDAIHPEDRARVMQIADKTRRTGRAESLEYRMRHKNGEWRVLESTASAIYDHDGKVEKLVIVNRDITDRKRVQEMLAHNAFHDTLTDLPNRALFLDRLQHSVIRARRYPEYRCAVLFIDIDEFRVVNDSLGHPAGDELLIQISKRLISCFRQSDTVSRTDGGSPAAEDGGLARLGGDEFTVLLEDISDVGNAVRVGQRILERLQSPFVINDQEVVISASVGIAMNSASSMHAETLVRDAELAMYRAKQGGKKCCEVFDPDMHVRAVRRLTLEAELRKAIELRELTIYYQPIVSLASGRIVGFEALSRWQRANGLVLPNEFIPIADETGLILSINRLVLLDACRQLRSWQTEFPSGSPLTMSVNIAPRQFSQSCLANDIRVALEQSGIAAHTLQLEIMETTAMAEPEKASQTLSELHGTGVRLSIDDFGTGYSSLSRLQHLPVDCLKVDRSFICTMEDDNDSQEIVRLIIAMAHALKLRVVAEGTENEKQINALKRLHCEMAQGYFFARPMPANAITELLRKSNEHAAAARVGR